MWHYGQSKQSLNLSIFRKLFLFLSPVVHTNSNSIMYPIFACFVHLFIVFLTFYCQNFSETGPKIDQGLCLVQVRSNLVEIRKFSVWWLVWSTRQDPNWIRAIFCLNQARFSSNPAVFCSFLTGSNPPFVTYGFCFPFAGDLTCDKCSWSVIEQISKSDYVVPGQVIT